MSNFEVLEKYFASMDPACAFIHSLSLFYNDRMCAGHEISRMNDWIR